MLVGREKNTNKSIYKIRKCIASTKCLCGIKHYRHTQKSSNNKVNWIFKNFDNLICLTNSKYMYIWMAVLWVLKID